MLCRHLLWSPFFQSYFNIIHGTKCLRLIYLFFMTVRISVLGFIIIIIPVMGWGPGNNGMCCMSRYVHSFFLAIRGGNIPVTWWCNPMEAFSTLLALCARDSPVTAEFPSQRSVTQSIDGSLICAWTNDWLNNRDAGDLRRHRAHYDATVMVKGSQCIGATPITYWSRASVGPLLSSKRSIANWICEHILSLYPFISHHLLVQGLTNGCFYQNIPQGFINSRIHLLSVSFSFHDFLAHAITRILEFNHNAAKEIKTINDHNMHKLYWLTNPISKNKKLVSNPYNNENRFKYGMRQQHSTHSEP